jgi:hypothetical protein
MTGYPWHQGDALLAADLNAAIAAASSAVAAGGPFLPLPGGVGGPTWTSGSAAPSSTQPVGSLYSRAGGAVGATLYVSRGGGTWAPVAGV